MTAGKLVVPLTNAAIHSPLYTSSSFFCYYTHPLLYASICLFTNFKISLAYLSLLFLPSFAYSLTSHLFITISSSLSPYSLFPFLPFCFYLTLAFFNSFQSFCFSYCHFKNSDVHLKRLP